MSQYSCALTGLTPLTDPTVTPSGHICSRKLLLTKLSENGGFDPFDSTRSLDESSLIDLQLSTTNNSNGADGNVAPPRPPKATSLPSMLTQISTEFDTILLELYDTRKSLEETRRELSSALYQNDAAVRVVARLARERDEARGKLEEVLRSGVAVSAGEETKKRGVDGVESDDGPTAKKPRADNSDNEQTKDLTKIPHEILTKMTSTWEILSKNRRAIAKKSKRSKEQVAQQDQFLVEKLQSEKKVNLGKSTARPGVLCLAKIGTSSVMERSNSGSGGEEYIVSGGHDKQAIVYNVTTGQIVATLSGAGGDVISVSGIMVTETTMVVSTGSVDGVVRVYSVPVKSGSGEEEVTLLGSAKLDGQPEGGSVVTPVNVVVHFSSSVDVTTLIVAGSDGSVNVFKYSSESSGVELITHLPSSDDDIQFSSGCLHPDGLIYAAGTTTGKVFIYDLKTQSVAGTLSGHDGNVINCINISENGYHVATSSSVDSSVHIWDLRKLKLSATISPSDVGTVTSLSFDPMGLYLAYSGDEATKVCVVKDWNRVVSTLTVTKSSSKKKQESSSPTCGGVVWGGMGGLEGDGKVWIGAGCDGDKSLRFWGVE